MTKMKPKNTEQSYSGWSNYETWNFKLWLDNSVSSQKIVNGFIIKSIASSKMAIDQIWLLKDLLRGYARKNAPLLKTGFYSDVLNASIRSVDYYQIADAYLDDYFFENTTQKTFA